MKLIIDPCDGDSEDNASSTKRRSLFSLAGSLLVEISLPKLAVAWTLLIGLPGIILGIAPLLLSLWIGTVYNGHCNYGKHRCLPRVKAPLNENRFPPGVKPRACGFWRCANSIVGAWRAPVEGPQLQNSSKHVPRSQDYSGNKIPRLIDFSIEARMLELFVRRRRARV